MVKAAQLVVDATYQDKKGNRRTVKSVDLQNGKLTYDDGRSVDTMHPQEFAKWAKCLAGAIKPKKEK